MTEWILDRNIKLRLLDSKDARRLFQLIDSCRIHLKKWLQWVDTIKDIQDAYHFIQISKNQFIAKEGFQAGIWYKGELAGVIGYHSYNRINKTISIGYWLGEKYVGKGIMIRACNALIENAFLNLKLNRVEIRCAEANFKSRAIPERLGFKREGVIREAEWLYDHYVNHVVYGMLASEWVQYHQIFVGSF